MSGLASPAVTLYDAAGVQLSVQNGVAIPAGTRALVIAGLDVGNVTRFIKTETDGTVDVKQATTAVGGALVKTFDFDTGAGVDTVSAAGIALPGAGGAVIGGTATNPIRTDPTGTTAQPVTQATSTATTVASVAAAVVNATILAANAARRGAVIMNDSASAILYLKCGAVATTASYTYKLFPGGSVAIEFSYTGIIDGIWDAAVGNARVTEFTP